MPNDPKEDEISLEIWCDLLEKEVKAALDDLAAIRKAKPPSEKRNIGIMLRAALGNARHYLSELVDSLKESPNFELAFRYVQILIPRKWDGGT